MDLSRPFGVVTPTVDGDVLKVLAGAEASFTGRQVQQLMGIRSERGVRNALQRLVSQGVVSRQKAGSADLYSLNRRHLAAPSIIAIAGLRRELLAHLTDLIDGWPIRPPYAALFGSAARGDMTLESDLDVIVVRPDNIDADDDAWQAQLADLADLATAWTGNDTRVLEYGVDEVRGSTDAVLGTIAVEGIALHGSGTWLRAALRRRVANAD
jgi:hypothetical protein